jgi:predicted N-acetyltransferase YhbS
MVWSHELVRASGNDLLTTIEIQSTKDGSAKSLEVAVSVLPEHKGKGLAKKLMYFSKHGANLNKYTAGSLRRALLDLKHEKTTNCRYIPC